MKTLIFVIAVAILLVPSAKIFDNQGMAERQADFNYGMFIDDLPQADGSQYCYYPCERGA